MTRTVVYSRDGRHLRERARETADAVAALRDAEDDRVPVVAVGGEEAVEVRADADESGRCSTGSVTPRPRQTYDRGR